MDEETKAQTDRLIEGMKLLSGGPLALIAPVNLIVRTATHMATARLEGQGHNADASPITATLWLDDAFAPMGRVEIESDDDRHTARPSDVEDFVQEMVKVASGEVLHLPDRTFDLAQETMPGPTDLQLFVLEEGD